MTNIGLHFNSMQLHHLCKIQGSFSSVVYGNETVAATVIRA